ncbi:MAG: DEAD/DEAH box helicase family protein [Acidimicrobiaceae bacterium]|nr:DEAD/DEAH box helicase family protein [Acidimicrobiia bacterium]MCY4493669.1 DEAD/DEAH box helicase family protein [Acidimicrobiaceae bacterium]
MLADEPTIRPGLYRLPDDPVAPRVLIPGFKAARSVRGAFGWFSAGWIERLAPGLAEYLNRVDVGPIEFTVAPTFFSKERAALERAYTMSGEEAAQRVADVFVEGRAEASALGEHALDCMAWMVATGRLQLRIAVPRADSNYHPKVWLFDDGMNQVLARGSGNATARGVFSGVEHLDVDVTWIESSRARARVGVTILDDWACGRSQGIECVVELPDALEQDIISTAPSDTPRLTDYINAVANDMNPPWATDPSAALRARFKTKRQSSPPRLSIPDGLEWEQGRYAHQGEAVAAWERGPEPERGTIAMATGAGKTLTALICAARVQDRLGDRPLLVVVSAPSIPLIVQWRDEVKRFGVTPVAPSLESNADLALTNLFRALGGGGTHVLIVTNRLLASSSFQATVALKTALSADAVPTLLIGDEAHTLGAVGFMANKPDFLERRLALSATPERQYDPDGTEQIFSFFGPPVYEFGLDRAIGFCLVPYNYYVHAATLDGDELDAFDALTQRIGAALGQGADEDDESLTSLLIARRRIIETADAKLTLLREVLLRRGTRSLEQTLIYASAKNPEQFDAIAEMLTELDVRWAPVTQRTTANRSLLTRTFETFENGGYQVLLAKKVLDEGVDIPSVREAFIVASSTVQREWIQRRGRVLRRHPDKPWAIVHDFLAVPPAESLGAGESANTKKIVGTELERAYAFAAHADNSAGDSGVLSDLAQIRAAFWPDGGPPPVLQRAGDSFISPATPKGRPW